MIICVREENRQAIERAYGTIVEYKRAVLRYAKILCDVRVVAERISEVFESMNHAFVRAAECFKEKLLSLAESITELYKPKCGEEVALIKHHWKLVRKYEKCRMRELMIPFTHPARYCRSNC